LIHHITALLSYNSNYLLALAYSISTTAFIWLYDLKSTDNKSFLTSNQIVKHALIYGATVWLFSLLISSPVTILTWFLTNSYYNSVVKTGLDVVEIYNIQFTQSISYFITLVLSCIVSLSLGLSKSKGKAVISLFAIPLSFPVYFYYLIFSGETLDYPLFELLTLILPSLLVSTLSIWLIGIVPGSVPKT